MDDKLLCASLPTFSIRKNGPRRLPKGGKPKGIASCRIRCGQRQCPADKGGGDSGAVAGGVTGAVAGALIGGPIGAAVGGVAGAVAGGAAGTVIDPPEKVRTYVTCVPM